MCTILTKKPNDDDDESNDSDNNDARDDNGDRDDDDEGTYEAHDKEPYASSPCYSSELFVI